MNNVARKFQVIEGGSPISSLARIDEPLTNADPWLSADDLANLGNVSERAAQKVIKSRRWRGAELLVREVEVGRGGPGGKALRVTKDVDVIDIARRQLVRVPQGKEPADTELTGAAEFGCKLTALDVQLFATLTLDFLRDNKDNSNLTKEVEQGFNGVADDGAGATREAKFIRQNKGWIQLLKEAKNTPKADINPATDGWIASLRTVMDKGDHRYRSTSAFIMNTAKADRYARELNAPITGTALNADSPLRRFEGTRLADTLPEAMATAWDVKAVVVAVEQIKFTSAGGLIGDWERKATLTGIVRAELRSDEIDALEVEPLIANLVAEPVHLGFDPETPVDSLSEKARFVLADWRDVIRDTQVASALRFTVEATIAGYAGPGKRPELLVSQAPQIGPGHEGDYAPITEDAP